jgi:hypothetical protein
MSIDVVRAAVEEIIRQVLPMEFVDEHTEFHINPTGRLLLVVLMVTLVSLAERLLLTPMVGIVLMVAVLLVAKILLK